MPVEHAVDDEDQIVRFVKNIDSMHRSGGAPQPA